MCHGDFHLGVVAQRQNILHQALAEGTFAYDDTTVIVLDGTCHNLAGRGAVAVNEDGQGDIEVNRVVGGRMQAVGRGGLAFHGDDGLPFGDEHIDDVDRFVHQAAAIATQVEHKAFELAFLTHLCKLLLHLFGSVAGESTQLEVGNAIVEQLIIRYVVDLHLLAFQSLFNGFLLTVTLEFQRHLGARLSLQQVTDFLGVFLLTVDTIHLKDDIAGDDTCFLCRPAIVGVGDTGKLAVILDDGTDAAILARGHKLGVLDVRLGDENGVRVKAVEHGLDGSLVELAGVDFIDIVEVELTQEAVVDVEAFGDLEVVLLLLCEEADGEEQYQD